MAASATYGGIRQAAGASRFSAASYVAAADPRAAGGAAMTQPRASAMTARREPGSPYAAKAGLSVAAPATHHVLLALVFAEALALVGLRHGFRHYHGG